MLHSDPDRDGTGPDRDGTGPGRGGTGPGRDGTGSHRKLTSWTCVLQPLQIRQRAVPPRGLPGPS
jgi:hypothetical protein